MPRNLSEMTAEEVEDLAEQAAETVNYEIVPAGKEWTFRSKRWRVGVVHANRYPTKVAALTAIMGRMGTEERR